MIRTTCYLLLILACLAPGLTVAEGQADLDRKMTDADRVHLLSRTGFGAPLTQRIALEGLTRQQGIDQIINGLQQTPTVAMPAWTQAPLPHFHQRESLPPAKRVAFDRARDREIASLRSWWTAEMLQTESPATERLVMLWHDLVPTAYSALGRQSLAMARQNELFRRSLQGDWGSLLKGLIRDPALLRFLDGDRNRREHPNENLARELLELFTLGEGNYDEATVREAARALTGHGIETVSDLGFFLRTNQMDRGTKSLFGSSGDFDGDDLVDRVLDQPAAARHLARAYWHQFISDSEPGTDELDALAAPFASSGHSLAVLYRTVLESESFWDDTYRATLVKSPIDLATGLAASLEYPKADWAALPALQASMGQDFFEPPNVAGWAEGDAWLAPGRLLARYDAAAALANFDATSDMDSSSDESLAASTMMPAQGMMNAGTTSGEAIGNDARLILDVASEAWQGPVQLQVSLQDAEGLALWTSAVQTLARGRDTDRLGRLSNRTDLPRERLSLPVAQQAAREARTVRVDFLNDAAGPGGDRNLFVERIRLGPREVLPQGARQESDCVPENIAAAGDLWCQGSVTMTLPATNDAANPDGRQPESATANALWSAAAVRVLDVNRRGADGALSARLMLEYVTGPEAFAAELIQLRVREIAGQGMELRLGSFDCRPSDACVPVWPECAWTDPAFASMKQLVYRLGERDEAARGCDMQALPERTQGLLSALSRGLPQLLEHAGNALTRSEWQTPFDQLLSRVKTMVDTEDATAAPGGVGTRVWHIDPGLRPLPTLPETVTSLKPRVPNVEALEVNASYHELDPLAGLLPGIDGLAQTIAPMELPIHERLRAILAHPAFQLH